jgi:4-amino-4-deoxychorismate lyase
MYPFLETICAEFGVPNNLDFHQERLDRTLYHFHAVAKINIKELLEPIDIETAPKTKIRMVYNLEGKHVITQEAYQKRQIANIKLVDIGNRAYDFKYADRKWIYALLEEAGSDEIIMVKDGLVTDSSIANLAFFNGAQWVTPERPLLEGTRRAALLAKGVIHPATIPATELHGFRNVKCINAMTGWNESPALDTSIISG